MKQENCLRVRMLGGFSMEYANRPISFGKRTQSRFIQLFQLLMLHQEGVGKDQLIEALYGWEDIGNKNICLNNLVYRLRKQLASVGLPQDEYVKVSSGICVWNGTIPVDSDVQKFEYEYDAALHTEDPDRQVSHLMCAWNTYTGELLPQLASENWVIEESERLKKLYCGCVNRLGQLLKSRREYQQMLEVYKTAADLYPFEEYRGGGTGQPCIAGTL
ncbi:MAG: BTAD domain-containing putative transcriptional regulator [Eubacteriales bacterium]|nr:BTAD domain-containing putative transcriptional regulator [Eubacteriales bacterium]